MNNIEAIAAEVVDAAIGIHRELGPGLLESVYEIVLTGSLNRRGYKVDRQRPVDIRFDGMTFPAAFRVDLLIDDCFVVEIKAVEALNGSHTKQVVTYRRLMMLPAWTLAQPLRRDDEAGNPQDREQLSKSCVTSLRLRAFA